MDRADGFADQGNGVHRLGRLGRLRRLRRLRSTRRRRALAPTIDRWPLSRTSVEDEVELRPEIVDL